MAFMESAIGVRQLGTRDLGISNEGACRYSASDFI